MSTDRANAPLLASTSSSSPLTSPLASTPSSAPRLRPSRSMMYAVFVSSLSLFNFGYNTGSISGALPCLSGNASSTTCIIPANSTIHVTTAFQQGCVVSSVLLGALVGSLFGGTLADHVGRRRALLGNNVFFIVGPIGMAASPDWYFLVGLRFLTGVGVGVASVLVNMYVSEIAPADVRGGLGGIPVVLGTFGVFCSYMLAYAFADVDGNWRYMLGVGCVAAILQLLLGSFWRLLPESPRWLLKQGREAEALRSLRELLVVEGGGGGGEHGDGAFGEAREHLDPIVEELHRLQAEMKKSAGGAHLWSPRSASRGSRASRNSRASRGSRNSHDASRGYGAVGYGSDNGVKAPGMPGAKAEDAGRTHSAREREISLKAVQGSKHNSSSSSSNDATDDTNGNTNGNNNTSNSNSKASKAVGWRGLGEAMRSRKTCMPVIVSAGLQILQQVSGINIVIYYAVQVLELAGFSYKTACLFSSMVTVFQLGATVLLARLVDRVGRRPMIFVGLVGMVGGLVGLAISFLLPLHHPTRPGLAIAGMLLYRIAFSLSLGPLPYIITSEVFPMSYRGAGISFSWGCNWASNFVVSLTFKIFLGALTPTGTFMLYCAFCFFAIWFVYACVKETKGQTLEDLEEAFTEDDEGGGGKDEP